MVGAGAALGAAVALNNALRSNTALPVPVPIREVPSIRLLSTVLLLLPLPMTTGAERGGGGGGGEGVDEIVGCFYVTLQLRQW